MNGKKEFLVFGERVEVLVSTKESGGTCCVIKQTSPPGGGPPPHVHFNEEEIFTVERGEFELFDGERWNPLPRGEFVMARRGHPHTFRNSGTTEGVIVAICSPGGLDEYLEKISRFSVPDEMGAVLDVSKDYAIEFLLPGSDPLPLSAMAAA